MEVNGEHQNVRYLLKEGDVLVITFPEEERSTGLTPYEMPLDVVYEDEYLLVINKPAGIPTIPSLRHPEKRSPTLSFIITMSMRLPRRFTLSIG